MASMTLTNESRTQGKRRQWKGAAYQAAQGAVRLRSRQRWRCALARLLLPRRLQADEIYTVRKIVHPVLQAEWDLR